MDFGCLKQGVPFDTLSYDGELFDLIVMPLELLSSVLDLSTYFCVIETEPNIVYPYYKKTCKHAMIYQQLIKVN